MIHGWVYWPVIGLVEVNSVLYHFARNRMPVLHSFKLVPVSLSRCVKYWSGTSSYLACRFFNHCRISSLFCAYPIDGLDARRSGSLYFTAFKMFLEADCVDIWPLLLIVQSLSPSAFMMHFEAFDAGATITDSDRLTSFVVKCMMCRWNGLQGGMFKTPRAVIGRWCSTTFW